MIIYKTEDFVASYQLLSQLIFLKLYSLLSCNIKIYKIYAYSQFAILFLFLF